jgi:hypothetical protein
MENFDDLLSVGSIFNRIDDDTFQLSDGRESDSQDRSRRTVVGRRHQPFTSYAFA